MSNGEREVTASQFHEPDAAILPAVQNRGVGRGGGGGAGGAMAPHKIWTRGEKGPHVFGLIWPIRY